MKETIKRAILSIANKKLFICIALISITYTNSSLHAGTNEKEALKEMVALMLNANGHLCATATEINPLKMKNQYEVTCIVYRGGSATKTYIFNAVNGTAFEQ